MTATRITILAWAFQLGLAAAPAFGLDEANVLLIFNADSADAQQIASHYTQLHPGAHLLGISNVPLGEEMAAGDYLTTIRQPVLGELQRLEGLGTGIDCIVTTKDLPLRIVNPAGTGYNRYSSLESELAWVDAYDSAARMATPWTRNPYYYKNRAFDRSRDQIRLTSRLDGFAVEDVIAEIDRAEQAAVGRPGCYFIVDDDPDCAYGRMTNLRDYVLLPRQLPHLYDATDAFLTASPGPVSGYVSHGVHGGASGDYVANGLAFSFAPGSIFHTYESFNAYTFDAGGIGQMPQRQGLLAEWIARGGTAGTGHVQEPGTDRKQVTNEDLLFYMLLEGYTWAEAAWNATYQVSYVNTFVGDPLMHLRAWQPGDCDLDGDVDLFDLAAVKFAYGSKAGQDDYDFWADMDADGDVDLFDLATVKFNYGRSAAGGQQVPEPASLTLLAMGGCVALLGRKSRS